MLWFFSKKLRKFLLILITSLSTGQHLMTRRHHSPRKANHSIPAKANRLLNFLLVIMLLILFRIWHLSVVQHEQKLEKSKKPQKKVVVERAERGTIRDRYNLPLAVNKVQYNAAVSYAQIREIPAIRWEKTQGKKVKKYPRKEHVNQLSQLLSNILNIPSDRIEDLIYGKAALFMNIPFILKEDISENEYYQLKALEKDWPGIYAERASKRYYPNGKVAGDIIGYLGRINRNEFNRIAEEMRQLREYIALNKSDMELIDPPYGLKDLSDVHKRLHELEERAYTINDLIGKSGIEGVHDASLKGFRGLKNYDSDAKGNYLRELPGAQPPLSGHRFLLTISAELQEFAERLLIESEERKGIQRASDGEIENPEPWIKGGAIVVMNPNNGDILALASYPRFDPNDFIPSGKQETHQAKLVNVRRWLETESHIADLWDQKVPLTRERISPTDKSIIEEEEWITWDNYLKRLLPDNHQVIKAIRQFNTIAEAVKAQQLMNELLYLCNATHATGVINTLYSSSEHIAYHKKQPLVERKAISQSISTHSERILTIRNQLDVYFCDLKNNYDKLLLMDLFKVIVNADAFSSQLLEKVGNFSLNIYKDHCKSMVILHDFLCKEIKQTFRSDDFKGWRELHQKQFLKEKRRAESLANTYQRPYIDYIDGKEKELFELFWNKNKWEFLSFFLRITEESAPNNLTVYEKSLLQLRTKLKNIPQANNSYLTLKQSVLHLDEEDLKCYLKTLRKFEELERPLFSYYSFLPKSKGIQLEKHLASAFYPAYGFGFGRSQAFRQAAQQGSIFKLVTAYEALRQTYQRNFGTSFLFADLNPLTIIDELNKKVDAKSPKGAKWTLGYTLDGKPIPQLYKGGRLPRSSKARIGKVDIISALETSSNPYFSLLASDVIEQPQDLARAARDFSYGQKTGISLPGEHKGNIPDDIEFDPTGLYSFAIGQHSLVVTPLQTAVMLSTLANGGKVFKPNIVSIIAGKEQTRDENIPDTKQSQNHIEPVQGEVWREIFMPDPIRDILLKGMQQVILGPRGIGHPSRMKSLKNRPALVKDYLELQNQLIGKTSTAEVVERLSMDLNNGTQTLQHIWFGGISFKKAPTIIPPKSWTSAFQEPELVIVIYLKHGDYGKEAAPLAVQIIKKWREIESNSTAHTRCCIN